MDSYCVKCRVKTPSLDGKIVKMKNGRERMASKCGVCSGGKSRILPIA